MDEAAIAQYITDTLDGLDIIVASGDTFFYYDPDRKIPPDRRLPFATIVTSDRDDQASQLDRPSVFRLNIGISKPTYLSMFGPQGSSPGAGGAGEGDHDFTALDRLMPHPVYGSMYWVCVLNPSTETFQTVRALLAEAHDLAVKKYAKRRTPDQRRGSIPG